MPTFTFTSAQVDELIVEVARALGITTKQYADATPAEILTWKGLIADTDVTSVSSQLGQFQSA